MSYPKIGEFKNDNRLTLEPAPNGGWIVYQEGESRAVMPSVIGAYTNVSDMLSALSFALADEEDEE